ncbi:uncharacterized protein I206_106251 [Kwoniella pini CBS 10737]|uniref:BRCT domain-containing protein n=1 Tax=Kwoniella pini CBS 10737 TaxID=1296096 RepID=A0A1B9I1I3_9TREE|nr:uncharacterized protein I206_05077 [Kwoniella pini CBS 10737]OCF49384.1 hypothetical protein I206_05077 [Kwoniella pini CBS 10737]
MLRNRIGPPSTSAKPPPPQIPVPSSSSSFRLANRISREEDRYQSTPHAGPSHIPTDQLRPRSPPLAPSSTRRRSRSPRKRIREDEDRSNFKERPRRSSPQNNGRFDQPYYHDLPHQARSASGSRWQSNGESSYSNAGRSIQNSSDSIRKTSTGTRFFNNLSFCIHSSGGEGDWRRKDEIDRLREMIRYHAGTVSRSPSSKEVSHIILPLNSEHQQDWMDNDIIRYFAQNVGFVPEEEALNANKKKIVLRQEWLDECIRQNRIVGLSDHYAGWEIKGTHDPQFVNITPFGEPHLSFDEFQADTATRQLSAHQAEMSPLKSQGFGLKAESQDVPPIMSDRSGETSLNYPFVRRDDRYPEIQDEQNSNQQRPTEVQEEEEEDSKPHIVEVSRPETPELPSTDPLPIPPLSSRISSQFVDPIRAISPDSQIESPELTSRGSIPNKKSRLSSVDTPSVSSQSITTDLLGRSKGVFGSGVLPLGFHVIGNSRERRSLEMLITHTGGGYIIPKSQATIYVFPIPLGEIPTNPDHLEIIDYISSNPTQAVVTEDWIYDCIYAKRLLSLDEYRINKSNTCET